MKYQIVCYNIDMWWKIFKRRVSPIVLRETAQEEIKHMFSFLKPVEKTMESEVQKFAKDIHKDWLDICVALEGAGGTITEDIVKKFEALNAKIEAAKAATQAELSPPSVSNDLSAPNTQNLTPPV